MRSRWRARGLAVVDDTEAFRRSQPAYFHDRFSALPASPERPRVLFVSPYPICPPTHGGGLFMYYTLRELVALVRGHAIVMLDYASRAARRTRSCSNIAGRWSFTYARPIGIRTWPPSRRTPCMNFRSREVEWLIQRQTLLHRIDVIQLEYTALGQYARPFHRWCARCSSTTSTSSRSAARCRSCASPVERVQGALRISARDTFRAATAASLRSHPGLHGGEQALSRKLSARARAAHRRGHARRDRYAAITHSRAVRDEPHTMLFLGSFRHAPNLVALEWFARFVLPLMSREDARGAVARCGFGSAAAPRLRGSGQCGRTARIRGRYPAAVFVLRAVRLPDPQRLRSSGQAARSFRERAFRWFRRRLAPKAWRAWMGNSARWRTTRRVFRAKVVELLEDRELAARDGGPRQKGSRTRTGTWTSITEPAG